MKNFPVSEHIYKYGLYLPSGIGNTVSEIKQVIKVIKNIFKKINNCMNIKKDFFF